MFEGSIKHGDCDGDRPPNRTEFLQDKCGCCWIDSYKLYNNMEYAGVMFKTNFPFWEPFIPEKSNNAVRTVAILQSHYLKDTPLSPTYSSVRRVLCAVPFSAFCLLGRMNPAPAHSGFCRAFLGDFYCREDLGLLSCLVSHFLKVIGCIRIEVVYSWKCICRYISKWHNNFQVTVVNTFFWT